MADSVKCICSLRVSVVHAPVGVSVVDGGGETPGPIPNPEAKPARADGTAPGREWESRLPPTQQLHTNTRHTPTLMVRGGCSIYPAPVQAAHLRIADTAGTYTLGLLGVQDGPAPLRTTPVPPCGHRDSALQTPQVTTDSAMQTSRREGWLGLITDNAGNALRTPQAPTHSTMQTSRPMGKHPIVLLRTPPVCIADSWIVLDCGHSNSAIRPARTIADSASLHCRRRRYLHTPQCRLVGR